MDNTQIIGSSISNGRYTVRSLLGEGGMGQVLLADDRNLGLPVVIKVPHAILLRDREFAVRFRREIRSLVKLSHHSIVKITDVGEHEGLPFAVMQYLDGGSLEDRLANGPMPLDSLSDWLPDVARALDFIHREGYIHRDIKPANILFDREGHPYLSDFGIAKAVGDLEPGHKATAVLTGAGMVLGTAEYMAPELVMGETFDSRVDQYALAATVYEVLSGQTPFRGPTAAAIMVKQTAEAAPDLRTTNAALSASVAGAVSRALSKKPDGRFGSCAEFAAAVVPTGATTTSAVAPRSTKAAGEDRVSMLSCPQCGRKLRTGPQHAEKVIRCPGCQTKLRVSSDLSHATVLPANSSPTSTTALPMMTGLHPSPVAVGQFGPVAAGTKSRRSSIPVWLTWSIGGGVAAVLALSAILYWHPTNEGTANSSIDSLAASSSTHGSESEGPVPDSSGLPSEITNSIGMRMKLIPAGSFLMGSPETEVGREADEGPQHQVEITRPFYLGVYEVTQREWESVKGTTPWKARANVIERENFPATFISWDDATKFCEELTLAELRSGHLSETEEYRLPTEAEWEYACRAGTTTAYSFGSNAVELDKYEWFDGNAMSAGEAWAHEVGQKLPNGFGLHDMHGNVFEWCSDWYGTYPSGTVTDPRGPSTGSDRLGRGGSWDFSPAALRSAERFLDWPVHSSYRAGFRLTRSSIK